MNCSHRNEVISINDTQMKGALTEQRCFLKCLELGMSVSKPICDNARYDFILDTGKSLLRIQVKTSRWKNELKEAIVFNCYSQHSLGTGNKVMKYTSDEVDFFMTEKDGIFYLVPVPENGVREKVLRFKVPASGQTKNISFASDFVFDEVIKSY